MSGERFEFPAPRPWRLEGEAIRDADGGVVVSALNPANMETRALIVRAVNGREDQLKAREMLQAECRGLAAEADRMAEFAGECTPSALRANDEVRVTSDEREAAR